MDDFEHKRIADALYGTIGLSSLEVQLINSQAFQRLRNVKHLGLVHYVYPGADFSRFSHSLGVCHITGRILESIQKHAGGQALDNDTIKLYRLAGLLHDIGHLPFSHVTESAAKDHYKLEAFVEGEESDNEGSTLNHERIGKQILECDNEIRSILEAHGLNGSRIASIFMREEESHLKNIISSDLDADRIDYLIRGAYYSGLPYGSVDLDYIVSQFRLDKKHRPCLTRKALRAADHFLLSRHFQYQQVIYHKTVVAFEWILKELVTELLRRKLLSFSKSKMEQDIANGLWITYDDGFVLEKIKGLQNDEDTVVAEKAAALLNRCPPKLLWSWEQLGGRPDRSTESRDETYKLRREKVSDFVENASDKFGIDKQYWYLDSRSPALTSIGSRIPASATLTGVEEEREQTEKSVRIEHPNSEDGSRPLSEEGSSLMRLLSDNASYQIRLFLLAPKSNLDILSDVKDFAKETLED